MGKDEFSDCGTVMVRAILSFLMQHPDAKDTIEGILTWWLAELPSPPGSATVEEALAWLVTREWITEREVLPARKVYGLHKTHEQEIRLFLLGPLCAGSEHTSDAMDSAPLNVEQVRI
jgi:hypothetical protein